MATRSPSGDDDGPCLSRRRSRRASLGLALHDLSLSLRHQTQLAAVVAEQEQWVEVFLAFAQPPVQAAATMPTSSKYADHLAYRHAIADVQFADHRLVRGSDRAVVNADDGLAGDRSDERHCAAGGGKDYLTGLGYKINTAMTR